jgi:hypothetical protein
MVWFKLLKDDTITDGLGPMLGLVQLEMSLQGNGLQCCTYSIGGSVSLVLGAAEESVVLCTGT